LGREQAVPAADAQSLAAQAKQHYDRAIQAQREAIGRGMAKS